MYIYTLVSSSRGFKTAETLQNQRHTTVSMEFELPVEPQSLKKLSFKSLKRTLDLFSPAHDQFPPPDAGSKKIRLSQKLNSEYQGVRSVTTDPASTAAAKGQAKQTSATSTALALPEADEAASVQKDNVHVHHGTMVIGPEGSNEIQKSVAHKDLVISSSGGIGEQKDTGAQNKSVAVVPTRISSERNLSTSAIMERIPSRWPRPESHAPWKNYRVISGHLGWVRSVAVDPSNKWFCTGSADRTIKIWDLPSGRLKLTLTGHIDQVRGLAVSTRHTYMFSAGDDKLVKCWDLEQNKVIRGYHGHLSGVYCLALHPTIDLLFTGGRDSVCRVWDIRTKIQAFALSGHENTVCSVFTRPTDPQVVTGSHDSTIKFWDLRMAGKTMATLTHHKKSVRAMALHPKEDSFVSASAENIKKFQLPQGEFMHNLLTQQKTIINAAAANEDGVLATAGDNGSLWFWDWKSGYNFQQAHTIVQPGSLDSEAGIYAATFDRTGSRLITCEADKTIKMWKEDDTAKSETHPIHFKPPKDLRRF